ncbi:MAG: peptidylprolyl isomerase [Vicinamibacterales bacterium]
MIAHVLALTLALQAGRTPAPKPTPKPAPRPRAAVPAGPVYFTSPLSLDDMRGKQAVLETPQGAIVLDLLPEAAPNHVAHFIVKAREGAYDGTTFHRAVPLGIIQGGDPLSKDQAQRARYGTGGLNTLRFEANPEKHTRGAVSAVLVPGKPDSAGSQFFICIADQPALDGQYTVFARVAEGMNVAQKISQQAVDPAGLLMDRVEVSKVTIRDKPPPVPDPFTTETDEQLSGFRAVIETSMGAITLEMLADRAPNHVRNFLRLAQSGVYDGTAFHRVAKGFVIQGGYLPTRKEPLDDRQNRFVKPLQPEFSKTTHDKGIVSMARGDDPASATSSFFIVTAPSPGIDGVYTVFARVVEGMDVVEKIEAVPVNGETPVTRVDVTRVRVVPR